LEDAVQVLIERLNRVVVLCKRCGVCNLKDLTKGNNKDNLAYNFESKVRSGEKAGLSLL